MFYLVVIFVSELYVRRLLLRGPRLLVDLRVLLVQPLAMELPTLPPPQVPQELRTRPVTTVPGC